MGILPMGARGVPPVQSTGEALSDSTAYRLFFIPLFAIFCMTKK